MTIPWIFDDDEHFLKACGITTYPEYEHDCTIREEQRIKEFMTSALDLFGDEFVYYDENPNEDPFGYDMLAHTENDSLPPMDEVEEKDEEVYQLDVRAQLANAIDEFLSFSTKEQLLKFIDSQLN